MSTSPPQASLLVIGAARSATTAVAEALARRGVFLSTPKEPHFWAFHGTQPAFRGPGDDEMITRDLVLDDARYRQLLEQGRDARWRGDGSVSTLYHFSSAIPTISRYASPDCRLVCVLREPAARAWSAFQYLRSRGHETERDFDAALALEESRTAAGYHHMWHYRAMSHYGAQLSAFHDAFGPRLFVAITEEIGADPGAFSRRLCDFLGIDESPEIALDPSVNRSGEPRSRLLTSTFNLVRRNRVGRRVVAAGVPRWARERVRGANLATPAPGDLSTLRRLFTGDIATVEAVLGRRVEAWR